MAAPRTPGPRQAPAGGPISNLIFRQLCDLGLAAPERLELISPGTRDAEVPVYRDALTGVILLDRNIYADPSGQGNVSQPCRPQDLNEVGTSGGSVSTPVLDDGSRRFQQFQDHLRGKRVCDFGAGEGDFIENCLQAGCAASGVEQGATTIDKLRARLADRAPIAASLDDLDGAFDVITLFHVLEHIEDHLGALRRIGEALVEGGLLIIEVPHARDFLLCEMELAEFREFTFWSEHLILHTRESLLAAVLGVIIAYTSLRLSRHAFAIVSLSFALLCLIIARDWVSLTRGPMGIPGLPIPEAEIWGLGRVIFDRPQTFYYVMMIFAIFANACMYRLISSRLGRTLRAIKQNEPLAQSQGINPLKYKLLTIGLSALLTGMAGGIYVFHLTIVDPSIFDFYYTETMLIMVITGGPGSFWGVLGASAVFSVLPEVLRFSTDLRMVMYGGVLIAAMLVFPRGVGGWLHSRRLRQWRSRR